MRLKPMVDHLERAAPCKAVMDKWREGIRGRQLWESLFEMEMCLRLVQAGADVTPDVEVGGKAGRKRSGKAGRKVVDLEFGGCYAEVYSPLEGEVLVPEHIVTLEDPGAHFMHNILSKGQLEKVGDHETLVVVECPVGLYSNAADLGQKMRRLLGKSGRPGAVFFVAAASTPRRMYECITNPNAVAPVSESVIGIMKRALSLEFPQADP